MGKKGVFGKDAIARIQTLKNVFSVTSIALICGRVWTQLSQPLAQYLILSPGTLSTSTKIRLAGICRHKISKKGKNTAFGWSSEESGLEGGGGEMFGPPEPADRLWYDVEKNEWTCVRTIVQMGLVNGVCVWG